MSKVKEKKVVDVIMIDNIHKLPLHIFKDCVIRQDFIGLCLQGIPTVDDFFKAWDKIYYDYLDAIGGKEFKSETEKIARWSLKQSKLFRFEQLLRIIDVGTTNIEILDEEDAIRLYDMLFSFGYDVVKKPFSIENLREAIKQSLPYFKLEKTRIEIEIAEEQDGVKSENVPYTDEYFTGLEAELSVCFQMEINDHQITLGKFCTYLNKYRNKIEQLENKKLQDAFN